jgi:hypothetical protein
VVVDELTAGAALSFEFEAMPLDAPLTMTGRVTELDPPRVFGFYWGEDHLRFELEPVGDGGCELRLTVRLGTLDKAARDAAGWHVCLDRLESGLGEHGESGGWRDYYDEYQRRGVPAGAPIPGE